MNPIYYESDNSKIIFVIVDRTGSYANNWTTEIIKNISDFNISSIWSKGYSVAVGIDEDQLLEFALSKQFKIAVVISTGTDFINGNSFFDAVKELSTENFLVAGHVLDRKEAFYELHHQCYIINLQIYKELGLPEIGQQALGEGHTQLTPIRSKENIHDDYTPLWVTGGNEFKTYNHKLHGWNLLSVAFEKKLTVKVFDDNFRLNKKYYYPENNKEFLQQIRWAYSRERYCSDEHIHESNTEWVDILDNEFECIITPASGTWFTSYIAKDKPVKVIFYDYNQSALDYWQDHAPRIENVSYEFVKIDLLGQCNYEKILKNNNVKTLINLSNIFCYEGTSVFSNLCYRLSKENELLQHMPKDFYVLFNSRSFIGFHNAPHYGKNLQPVNIKKLIKPTWHINQDWV